VQVDRALLNDLGALRVALPGLSLGPQLGDRRSPHRGRGMEFADHRPYRPGDDLRLVDWNVYNRLRQVLVRLFHEDRNLHLGICVDCSASMGVGTPRKDAHAATLAAALALIGLRERDTVTLAIAGGSGSFPRLRGHQARSFGRQLQALEAAQPGGAPDLADTIRRLADRGRIDRAILISDLLTEDDDAIEGALRALSTIARRPAVLHVLAADEVEPDLSEGIEAEDAETGEVLAVGDRAGLGDAYQRALEDYLRQVRTRCVALRVQYVPAFTSIPLRTLVLDALRRGRVVENARGAGR